MKKIIIFALCCLVSVLALINNVAAQSKTQENKIQTDKDINLHQIIRIHYSGAVIPEVLKAKPGSTVVWINESKSAVEIQFEGKQVTLACKSPVHFTINDDGSFISDRIPNGSVASLCFIEQGEFNYVARKTPVSTSDFLASRDRMQEFKGKIIIKNE
jgi:hypothetical protein